MPSDLGVPSDGVIPTGGSAESPRPQAGLQFAWEDLPAVTESLPGTAGETRRNLEDFVVFEEPSYLPSGQGTHAYALVEKRGRTTRELISALGRMGVSDRQVGVAGQKDKYAVTRQWLSVPEEFESQLRSLDDLDGVAILDISRHANKLGLGHLRGNHFEVRVRDPEPDWRPKAEAVLEQLASSGLPNYVGPQRFGRNNSNADDGARVLRGERVPADRRLRRFFLSALQSHLFNWMLRRRMEDGLLRRVVEGDLAQKHDTGGMFTVEDAETESARAERLEISATLLLFGKKVHSCTGDAGAMESETLREFGLRREDFRVVRGSRRISRVKPADVSLEGTDDGYVVRFMLPKGAFATCLLRELVGDMRTPTDPKA